ncbi:hypothetical protein GCM10007053_01820 [Halioglobus pacificus]|uniref:Uncharacterized protein n=1 Tax=Parahalioglobus pacificus TaxID=930806 RepID=A0A919CHG7_9GAMM|nr:hypothetical protein GCM10007053_01820 [Halioglobus pacificus]
MSALALPGDLLRVICFAQGSSGLGVFRLTAQSPHKILDQTVYLLLFKKRASVSLFVQTRCGNLPNPGATPTAASSSSRDGQTA